MESRLDLEKFWREDTGGTALSLGLSKCTFPLRIPSPEAEARRQVHLITWSGWCHVQVATGINLSD